MRLRTAAVVAGLALGSVSVTAQAATITYNVDLVLLGGTKVTGFIETDGAIGEVRRKDITDLYLKSGDTFISEADLRTGSAFLSASNSDLKFVAGQSFFNVYGDNGVVTSNDASRGSVLYFSSEVRIAPGASNGFLLDGVFIPSGTDYVIGTVPLPSSAPMFGTALLGLAGLGYVAKRKEAAPTA